MCDSSIGGKTAINTPHHVNTLGTYKHPIFTFIGLDLLSSLSTRDFSAGISEVIKVLLLNNNGQLSQLLLDHHQLSTLSSITRLQSLLKISIESKLYYTDGDITEKHKRLYLNFGHTFGHPIESLQDLSYEEYFRHGEAVALGMVCACSLSDRLYGTSNLDYVKNLLTRYNLPVSLPHSYRHLCHLEDNIHLADILTDIALKDKKGSMNKVRIVLLKDIGNPILYTTSDRELLKTAYQSIIP